MKKVFLLLASHVVAIVAGFAVGVYTLPILIAPEAPSHAEVKNAVDKGLFSGEFRRDLKGSDFLHWGEGTLSIGPDAVVLMGELAPGPDYRLYLSPRFVEDETGFKRIKADSVEIGPVKTFKNFMVALPAAIDPTQYNTVVVWCESFAEFITAAQYRNN